MTPQLVFSSFLSNMEGGTTTPWLIRGTLPNGSFEDVVLKLFNQNSYGKENPTLNEFLSLYLADEFDIDHLDPYIVTFKGRYEEVLNEEQIKKIKDYDRRNKAFFGCRYYEGALNKPKTLRFSDYHFESIFAFDVLIMNPDRRIDKPNLLYTTENEYIIDHEQCFLGCVNFSKNIDNRIIWNFINPGVKECHLYLKELKRLKKHNGFMSFSTFAEGLKHLNINKIDQRVHNLERHGIDVSNWDHIKKYLYDVKNDISGFIGLLNDIIETP